MWLVIRIEEAQPASGVTSVQPSQSRRFACAAKVATEIAHASLTGGQGLVMVFGLMRWKYLYAVFDLMMSVRAARWIRPSAQPSALSV